MELHYGNLIEKAKNGEFDVIIHGANCFHTMGAGIAKHIKINFPEAFEADKRTGYGDKNKIGTFSEATIEKNGHTFIVINAYSQYRYGNDKDHFEYDSFPQLLQSIKAKYGHLRIGIPLIGCGLAGGNEPRILNMIDENFKNVDYKLVEIDVNRKLNLGPVENTATSSTETPDVINFTKVALPYGWMGNMAPYPVTHEGIEYKTTEALFQSLRFAHHPDIQQKIREQHSPMSAKMVARENIASLDGFVMMGEQDVQNMKLCVKLKLEQHPELKAQLIESGNTPIIEDCTSRPEGSGVFWGAAKQNGQWVGKNVLGEILMQYRTQLQNNMELSESSITQKPLMNNQPEQFTFFFHSSSPFSQWHPATFIYKDYQFISTEQFMMFSKAKTFKDEVVADKAINIEKNFIQPDGTFTSNLNKSCYQIILDFKAGQISAQDILKTKSTEWNAIQKVIKQLGREVSNYDDAVWSAKRVSVVSVANREKFTQNPDLLDILIKTQGTTLVESSPYDKIWGIGLDKTHPDATNRAKWKGLNLLGQVLTTLRDKILEMNPTSSTKMKM